MKKHCNICGNYYDPNTGMIPACDRCCAARAVLGPVVYEWIIAVAATAAQYESGAAVYEHKYTTKHEMNMHHARM